MIVFSSDPPHPLNICLITDSTIINIRLQYHDVKNSPLGVNARGGYFFLGWVLPWGVPRGEPLPLRALRGSPSSHPSYFNKEITITPRRYFPFGINPQKIVKKKVNNDFFYLSDRVFMNLTIRSSSSSVNPRSPSSSVLTFSLISGGGQFSPAISLVL